jgi:hypothetical protein
MYGTLLAEKLANAIQNVKILTTYQPTHDCRNGGLRVEQAHFHGIFGLSDYHQERTSPTYSQRKNNPRQLHPIPKSSCAQNVVVLK